MGNNRKKHPRRFNLHVYKKGFHKNIASLSPIQILARPTQLHPKILPSPHLQLESIRGRTSAQNLDN